MIIWRASIRDWSKSIVDGGGGGWAGTIANVVDKKTHGPPPPFGTKMTDPPLKQGWKLHDLPLVKTWMFGVLTVLDAKNGFWYIQFDEPDSLATTFVTP